MRERGVEGQERLEMELLFAKTIPFQSGGQRPNARCRHWSRVGRGKLGQLSFGLLPSSRLSSLCCHLRQARLVGESGHTKVGDRGDKAGPVPRATVNHCKTKTDRRNGPPWTGLAGHRHANSSRGSDAVRGRLGEGEVSISIRCTEY